GWVKLSFLGSISSRSSCSPDGAGTEIPPLRREPTFFQTDAFLPGMPTRLSYDRVATIYDATRGLAPRAMARVLGVLVDELHGKRVLEVGVGTGRYAVPLQKSGIRVVGVDISRSMVEFGLAKGLRDVVFADGAHL